MYYTTENSTHIQKFGVYRIMCMANGRWYIGSTVQSFKTRWYGHELELTKGIHTNKPLQNAWDKYGAISFRFDILEVIDDRNLVQAREQYHLDCSPVHMRFNVASDTLVPARGLVRSDAFKKKCSLSKKGKPSKLKGCKRSPEAIEKMIITRRINNKPDPRKGKPVPHLLTPEAQENRIKARRNRTKRSNLG
jgi:group I intron endonuclease